MSSTSDPYGNGWVEDVRVSPDGYPAVDQPDYIQRILRHQLDEKLSEIQQGLGLTDLAMMEVVIHWMKTKVRDLRDAEVEAQADEDAGPVSSGGYPVGP